jgi:predicted nucleic acid-binding protein
VIILDTNVVSEMVRPLPHQLVVSWFDEQEGADLHMTSISAAELYFGLACMPAGRRRDELSRVIADLIAKDFEGRVLSFDHNAARHYAQIAASRRTAGRPMSTADCQIAAIARSHGAAVATRNVTDFAGCGTEIVDPWQAT